MESRCLLKGNDYPIMLSICWEEKKTLFYSSEALRYWAPPLMVGGNNYPPYDGRFPEVLWGVVFLLERVRWGNMSFSYKHRWVIKASIHDFYGSYTSVSCCRRVVSLWVVIYHNVSLFVLFCWMDFTVSNSLRSGKII